MNNNLIISNLTIITLNINSLISIEKKYCLQKLIETYNPDIILLTETKLNTKHKIYFDNYKIIRNDRINSIQGGGTAILIKNIFKFRIIDILNKKKHTCIESTTILLKLKSNDNLYISAIYAPQNNQQYFKYELEDIFKSLNLDKIKNYYIIGGDFNAKHTDWKNKSSNIRGNILKNWINNNSIPYKINMHHSDLPSYPRTESYLDLCITDNRIILNNKELQVGLKTLPFASDHNAIYFNITIPNDNINLNDEEIIHIYNYKSTNWKKFAKTINKNYNFQTNNSQNLVPNDRNLNNNEIDLYIKKLEKIIHNSITEIVPKFKKKTSVQELIDNKLCRKLHDHKNLLIRAMNKMYRLNYPKEDFRIINIKARIKNTNQLLKENLKINLNKFWHNKINKINPNNPNMFSTLNKIFKSKSNLIIKTLKIKSDNTDLIKKSNIKVSKLDKDENNNYIINKPENILQVFGTIFEEKHKKIQNNTNITLEEKVNKAIKNLEHIKSKSINFTSEFKANELSTSDTRNNNLITKEKLNGILLALKNKTSVGIDKIPNIVLKNLPYIITKQYLTIINNSLNNNYFPKDWKTAIMIPIIKPGKDPTDPYNYRPISLLPNISKVFEKIIKETIVNTTDKLKIINDNQFGFREKHSTIHAINKLVSDICWHVNNNECVSGLLIDVKDAFTSIWTKGLIHKLVEYKFPINQIKIIQDMITDKTFIVQTNRLKSKKIFKIKNGLQQGTVTSPMLFLIYINELLNTLNNQGKNKYSIAFADDIIIYTSNKKFNIIKSELQNLFNIVQSYIYTWKLSINYNKCELILFRNKLKKCHNSIRQNWKQFCIRSESINIAQTNNVKYLGINISFNLNYTKHISIILEKAKKAFAMAKRLFYCKNLDVKIKILAYQTLIRPILTYGCSIWFNISASLMEKIRLFERKCLRTCLNSYRKPESHYKHYISNKKIYNKAKIIRVDNFIIKLIRKHYARAAETMHNSNINHPVYTDEIYIKKTINNEFITPESFIYLDKRQYIQNINKIPIFYHINRRATKTEIGNDTIDNIINYSNIKFNTDISTRDKNEKINKKIFFWLE